MTDHVVAGDAVKSGPPPEVSPPPASSPPVSGGSRALGAVQQLLFRYGLVVAFLIMVAIFSIAKPHVFPTADNAKAILEECAPPGILAIGLTAVLVMNDFDLSFASVLGLGSGIVTLLIVQDHVGWVAAVLIALLVGVGVGLINGFLIAVLGGSSFIITLAMGTVITGVEYAVTGQKDVFVGFPSSFTKIAQSNSILGINNQVWIATVIAILGWVMLEKTEVGRFMYAIGGNSEAARLAGVRVRMLRILGFVLIAACAIVAGVLLTSLGGSVYAESRAALPAAGVCRRVSRRGRLPARTVQHPRHRRRRPVPGDDPDGTDDAEPLDLGDQRGAGRDPDHRDAPQPARGEDGMSDAPSSDVPSDGMSDAPGSEVPSNGISDAPASTAGSAPLLEVRHLRRSYPGVLAVDDVSLTLADSEILGLVGPNGAGKSTLIKMLAGAVRPEEGEILIRGEHVEFVGPLHATQLGLSFVHQELTDVPNLSVAENVLLGLKYPRWVGPLVNERAMHKRAREILSGSLQVEIDPTALMTSLSVAQRRLVMVARGLATEAKVLVLDEPTASLTNEEIVHLHEVIRRVTEAGTAVIYVSHRLDEIFALTARVVVMRGGRKVADVSDRLTDPAQLVDHITGQAAETREAISEEVGAGTAKHHAPVGEELLRVEGLTRTGVVEDASFVVASRRDPGDRRARRCRAHRAGSPDLRGRPPSRG